MQPLPQARDHAGRFGHRERAAVELDLVPDTLDAGDVQDAAYTRAWNTSTYSDVERAAAARAAINAYRESDPELGDVLGPDPDAVAELEEALRDDDTVLDSIHLLGPLPYPQSRGFGALLAGTTYDLWVTRRENDVEAALTASEPTP